MKQIRIMIVDPRQLIREGFEKLLHKPLFDVVAACKTLADALGDNAGMARADVVVLGHSTRTEVEAQIAALRHLPTGPHRPRVVLVTEIEEPDLLRQALVSGVDALLSMDISSRVLQRSLELVALGQRLFPVFLVHPAAGASRPAAPGCAMPEADEPEPKPASGLITIPTPLVSAMPRFGAQPPPARPDAALPSLQGRAALSGRESQILEYLVRALPNKAIALELNITEATVKVHVKALLRKIRASNRTEAAIWALSNRRKPSQAAEIAASPVAGAADRHAALFSPDAGGPGNRAHTRPGTRMSAAPRALAPVWKDQWAATSGCRLRRWRPARPGLGREADATARGVLHQIRGCPFPYRAFSDPQGLPPMSIGMDVDHRLSWK